MTQLPIVSNVDHVPVQTLDGPQSVSKGTYAFVMVWAIAAMIDDLSFRLESQRFNGTLYA